MGTRKKPISTQNPSEALPPFEDALAQIEKIVGAIESGSVSLEESLKQYAAGTRLIQHCRGILDRVESKIKELAVDSAGDRVEGSQPAQGDE